MSERTDATELDLDKVRKRAEFWASRDPENTQRGLYDRNAVAFAREVVALLAALDEARAEVDTHREVAESMTGLWEQEKDRATRLAEMADRLADRRANHEPWHCCCAEGSHAGQAAALNRMKARAEGAESSLAAVTRLRDQWRENAGEDRDIESRVLRSVADHLLAALAPTPPDENPATTEGDRT